PLHDALPILTTDRGIGVGSRKRGGPRRSAVEVGAVVLRAAVLDQPLGQAVVAVETPGSALVESRFRIAVAGVDDRDPVASVLIGRTVAALDEDRSRILGLIGLVFVEDVFHGPGLAIGFEADVLRAHLGHPLTFEVGGALGALLRVGIQLLPGTL